MLGVLEGFATIAIVIGLGALAAQAGLIDSRGQRSLSLIAFYIASPALLITVLQDSDPSQVLSGQLIATAAGVVVAAGAVVAALELVGGMAVPAMLIAYGVALRLGPLPGRGVMPQTLAGVTVLKMVVQPVTAYLVGRFAVGLDDADLFAVTLLSALPTAQNVFVIATRYERGVLLARDSIFVTTLLSAPVAIGIAALLA